MHQWLNQHKQAFDLVVQRLLNQRTSTIVIFLVIGVTLAIPSLIYILTNNAQQVLGELRQDTQISVFLSENANQETISKLKQSLENRSDIKRHVFVSKGDALKELKEKSPHSSAITSLNNNPLPHAFFIEPDSLDALAVESLSAELKTFAGVDDVVLDSGWMKKLTNIIDIGQQATWIFGSLLCFAIIAVISNTVRMQIVTQKEEIEVNQLFGATTSFIRRPFLYLGSAYGFGGGLFACLILFIVVMIFNQSVSEIAAAYQSEFLLRFNKFSLLLFIIAIATIVGWLSAFIAVRAKKS